MENATAGGDASKIEGTNFYEAPPGPPERLDLSFLNRTSVNLTWFDGAKSGYYVVCYIEASQGCNANTCKDELQRYL